MKNNTFKEIIKPIIVLTCICLVVTAALAYVNSVTAPIIEKAEKKAAEEARAEVLSEADSFEPVDKNTIPGIPDEITEIFKAENGAGYVFNITVKGYGGNIKLICGVKADGSIEKTKTLSHAETSSIGGAKVVDDNKSNYWKNFVGKTADNVDEVDAVSGATISSTAYKKAVSAALEAFDDVKEAE